MRVSIGGIVFVILVQEDDQIYMVFKWKILNSFTCIHI